MKPNPVLLFYLTWINPGVALVVLACCTGSALSGVLDDVVGAGTSGGPSLFEDPLALYFMGKGLFCSSLLFLFGLFFRAYLIRGFSRAD
ncbi:hypothetical protein HAHE_28260 [Haloferula helveola]|uniref:Uncharacterized protein n=1 Tax=Haloferula helveola TaxID=490095 RepID=A0ABM7RHU8_9BACT|nr:hypothetical protein HAHE_28260 [Haloferula helveola]